MYQVKTPGPTPLVKWAGGKAKMIPALLAHMPPSFSEFHSLFAGGMALYLHVNKPGSYCDSNYQLMRFYNRVEYDLEGLILRLEYYQDDYNKSDDKAAYYYARRETYNDPDQNNIDETSTAALFLFLNKCGFNGLYRVNRSGEFNAPWGKKKKLTLVSDSIVANMFRASILLQQSRAFIGDYSKALNQVQPGDFIYADPPYYSTDAGFTAYGHDGKVWLTRVGQEQLAADLTLFAENGAYVMTTNADTPFIRQLYQDWYIHEVEMPRRISAKTAGRGRHVELIITSYEGDDHEEITS